MVQLRAKESWLGSCLGPYCSLPFHCKQLRMELALLAPLVSIVELLSLYIIETVSSGIVTGICGT